MENTNEKKICFCCEEIKFWLRQKTKGQNKKTYAKISHYSWKSGVAMNFDNRFSVLTSEPYPLNYCPECGRKVSDILAED